MTKLRIISDTHFDAGLNGVDKNSTKTPNRSPFGSYFGKKLKEEQDCVTLIAGDMAASILNTNLFLNGFFNNQKVIFIDGNHCVFNNEGKTIYEIKQELRNNFSKAHPFWHYLENDWMWIPSTEDVAVIGTTFYTDYEYTTFTAQSFNEYQKNVCDALEVWLGVTHKYNPIKRLSKKRIINENLQKARESLNDFWWGIESKTSRLTPETYLKLHKLAKSEVQRCYNEILAINPKAKIILMTHHCLSPKCIDDRYINSKSNASYVSDLEKWVEKMPNIRLVVSGHVHGRKDFTFGKKKVRYILNPCGYIGRNEPFINQKFNPNLIIDTKDL